MSGDDEFVDFNEDEVVSKQETKTDDKAIKK
jgi:hypothetical protein